MKRITYILSLIILLLTMAAEANATTYRYYILNKSGWATIWCEQDQTKGTAPSIPEWMKSPLATNYRFYTTDQFTQGSIVRENYSEYAYIYNTNAHYDGKNELKYSWTKKDGAEELKSLSSNTVIFVTYDVVENFTLNIGGKDVPIDLTGQTYYNIQDVNGWYAMILKKNVSTEKITKTTNRLINQALSIPLPGKSTMWYKANSSKGTTDCDTWAASHGIQSETDAQLLWSFHASIVDGKPDPYDIQIKNKALCEMGHDDFVLTDYDYRAEKPFYNSGNPSKWPTGMVEGLNYASDTDLSSEVWQDNRIYVINPGNVENTQRFRIFKFAILKGVADDKIKIAEASICNARFDRQNVGLRAFGLCNYLIDYDIEDSSKNTGENTYHYAQEKVGGAIINGESVSSSTANADKYYLYNDLYTVTLTPAFEGNITFHLIDRTGKELMKAKVPSNSIPLESLPDAMKSTQVKNYKFYTQDAFTVTDNTYTLNPDASEVATIVNGMTDLYVIYDYDENSKIDLKNTNEHNISIGGKYIVTDAEGNIQSDIESSDEDTDVWSINSANTGSPDPYYVVFTNKAQSGKYLGVTSEGTLTLADTPTYFYLIKNETGGYTISVTKNPTVTENGDVQVSTIASNNSSGFITESSSSFDEKNKAEIMNLTSIINFHVISLAGNEILIKRLAPTFEGGVISMPEVLQSAYAKDYTFYSDADCTIPVTTVYDGLKDIYVKYSYNSEYAGIDLSKTTDYTVQDANSKYLSFNGTTFSHLDSDSQLDDVLWQVKADNTTGSPDPYQVSVVSRHANSYNLILDDEGNLSCGNTSQQLMITTDSEGKTKFIKLSSKLSSKILTFTEITPENYDYTFYIINKKGWTGLWYKLKGQSSNGNITLPNFMRSQLVSKYHFYTPENVVHKSMTEDATGRPLYKCYYYSGSKVITSEDDLAIFVGKYEKGSCETMAWPRKNTDIFVFYDVLPDEARIIDGVHIDLTGKTYYNIQDSQDAYLYMDKRYKLNNTATESQVWSFDYSNLQTVHGVTAKTDDIMLWSFYSKNDDPYDVQIKNKYISQTYPDQDLVVVESNNQAALYSPDGWPTDKGGDNSSETSKIERPAYILTPEQSESDYATYYATYGRINSFAFLQGTDVNFIKLAGSINGRSTADAQCFRFFGLRGYQNIKTGDSYKGAYYGMMRGSYDTNANKYLNNDLYRVKLTEYANKITYHVINLSGKEATSVSEFHTAGNPCTLNSMVMSPFATNYKYYKAEDVTTDNGIITVNEGAEPITIIPKNTTDIYVTYEYDTANTRGINVMGRNGTIFYNISANGKYLSTDGTNLTVTDAPSKESGNLWVIECNMVDGMPDPYDAHIYSWANCNKYLGGETTLALTDNASSTSFILGIGTSNSLFTLAKAGPVVEDVASGLQKMTYLTCDGTSFSFAESLANATAVQTTLTEQQINYTYHIINLSKEKSLNKVADNLLKVQIPYELSSPAVEESAYKYYASSSFTVGEDGKYTLNNGAQPIDDFQNLPSGEYDIYVTYTYDASTSHYDLTANTDYNIVMGDGSYATVIQNNNSVWVPKPDDDNILKPNDEDKSACTIYDPRALWTLQGQDPYKVKIYSCSITDRWICSNGSQLTNSAVLLSNTENGNYMTHVAILNMNGGDLRLVGVPYSPDSWYCFNTTSDSYRLQYKKPDSDLANTRTKLIRRVKHTYTFHLNSKIDNKEYQVEAEMYEDDNIAPPAELKRHFCTYKFYDSAEKTNEITVFSNITHIYIDYEVRDGIFMTNDEVKNPDTAPQKVFFLDYGTSINATYNTINGHSTITSYKVAVDDKTGDKFNEVTINTVGNVSNRYSCGSPSDLLWYFGGDPYCCQVYAAKHPGENLVPMSRKEPINMYKYRRSIEFSSAALEALNARIKEVADKNGKTYEPFHWEMVDGTRGDAEDGMSFALRFKESVGYIVIGYTEGVDVEERFFGQYYYLRPQGGAADNDNYQGSRQLDNNNVDQCALTLRRQARVYATVYNSQNVASPVTRNEISEFVAVGEKFDALPSNLRRKFCTYTLIDPDNMTDLSSESLFEVTKPKYDDNGNLQAHHIYARYEVDAVSPFCNTTTEDGQAVLEDANTKWFNFKIGGNSYVNFDRDYVGKDGNVSDNDHRITKQDITLNNMDAEGNYILPKTIMHKGLHWAFVGDPYKFYVIGHRHRTATYDATGYKMTDGEVGYIGIGSQNEICMSADREYFTFMMDATDGNAPQKYFMSFSTPRLTEQTGDGNRDIVQGSYYDEVNRSGFKVNYSDNYGRGTSVVLQRVKAETDADKETAQFAVFGQAVGNDVFDCILNVYNGENKVVASSGWTELLRSDEVNAKSLPLDIQRFGCTYKCWGDATMTKKQVNRYDEKMRRGDRWDYDGTGKADEQVYVLDDGCFIYTNYSYDSKHYSSENNYHWVNCHFDWDEITERTSVWSFTTKSWEEDGTTETGEIKQYRHWGDEWESKFNSSLDVKTSYVRYISSMEAPATEPTDGIVDEKVLSNRQEGDRKADATKDGMLWALVGDPYEFQIKSYLFRKNPYENYYIKVKDNAGYLRTEKQAAVDYDISNRPADKPIESTLTPEQKQGYTFTYKVDENGKPYLAQKDESATALSRRNKDDILVGAVKNYVTFDFSKTTNYREDLADGYSAEVGGKTYTKGTKYTVDYSSISDITDADVYEKEQSPFTDMKGTTEIQELKYGWNEITDESEKYTKTIGGMSTDENKLNTDGAKCFYVEPMQATAKSVVFNLKYYREDNKEERPGGSSGETMAQLGLDEYFSEGEEYPVTLRPKIENDYLAEPYEVKDYGVGTSLLLPWSYRRQYCTYYYRLVDVLETKNAIDFTSIKTREDISPYIGKYYDILDENLADYKLVFDVYYKTTEDYVPSTSANDAFWYNLTTTSVTTQEIEPVQFTYSNNMHKGPRKNHYTDDWLWAMEGDPYGMKLHNRYAQSWDEVLTIPTIPITVNVTSDIDPETGEPQSTDEFKTIVQDPSGRGTYSTVNKEGQTEESTTDSKGNAKTIYKNSHFFEMMKGNYSTAFLIHPIYAEIQDAYPAYFISMFLFNAGEWPVQLNEMLDREAKRNASANWTLQPIAKDQLYVYYQRRGYVGGLDPTVASNNKELFEKLSPSGQATYTDLKKAQKIVHDKNNLVPLQKGYYRIKAMSDEALTAYEADKTTYNGNRYVTGYLSDTEMTAGAGNSAVPLNFWTTTADKKGDLQHSDLPAEHTNQSYNRELLAAEYDPSSIFYFVPDNEANIDDNSLWNIQTQDLYVSNGFTMSKDKDTETASATDSRMRIDDIGGTLFTIREGSDMKTGYLNCSPDVKRFAVNKGAGNELHEKYDIQDTKWLLQPVGIPDNDIPGAMPLKFDMLDGKDGCFYCSAYLPYDITLSTADGKDVMAYIATDSPFLDAKTQQWKIMCKEIGTYNPGTYKNSQFVPANTPVLIVSQSNDVRATIPTDVPTSTTISDNKLFGSLLARQVDDPLWASENETNKYNETNSLVYVFGMANDIADFYLNGNANPHNENNFDTKYLYHNKAFLIESPVINSSNSRVCIPVFDSMPSGINGVYADEEKDNGPIYDLLGRKVKTVRRGVYIQGRRKVVVNEE